METYSGRFAARLRELRTKANLSQTELAERIGSKQRNVSNWEMGETSPPFDILPTLAEALAVSIAELMPKE